MSATKLIEHRVQRRTQDRLLSRLRQPSEQDGSGWVVLACALGMLGAFVLSALISLVRL